VQRCDVVDQNIDEVGLKFDVGAEFFDGPSVYFSSRFSFLSHVLLLLVYISIKFIVGHFKRIYFPTSSRLRSSRVPSGCVFLVFFWTFVFPQLSLISDSNVTFLHCMSYIVTSRRANAMIH